MKFTRPVIDSHWHLYSWEDQNGKDFYTGIDEVQEHFGLKAVNICSIPIYEDLGPAQNVLAALYKLHNPTAYAYGGIVYPYKPFSKPMPDGMDPLSQYNELMEIGFDGMKLLATKPFEQKQYQIEIDDEYFDSFFNICEKNQTHMIMHVADPAAFWDINKIPERFISRGWFYGDGTFMPYERMYEQVYNVLNRHPALKATFAHFFFLSEKPERLEKLFAKYKNISIDLTPGAEMYADFRSNAEFYKNFFERYSQRIIYGTDASYYDGWNEEYYKGVIEGVYRFVTTEENAHIIVEDCNGYGLSDKAKDNILYNNFLNAVGGKPKSINKAALKKYVEKYRHLIYDQNLLKHFDDAVAEF